MSGCIYIDTWGQITDTLETEDRFMPLTQVEINPAMPGNRLNSILSPNKERIISIGEFVKYPQPPLTRLSEGLQCQQVGIKSVKTGVSDMNDDEIQLKNC
jgi:hypothetical protein